MERGGPSSHELHEVSPPAPIPPAPASSPVLDCQWALRLCGVRASLGGRADSRRGPAHTRRRPVSQCFGARAEGSQMGSDPKSCQAITGPERRSESHGPGCGCSARLTQTSAETSRPRGFRAGQRGTRAKGQGSSFSPATTTGAKAIRFRKIEGRTTIRYEHRRRPRRRRLDSSRSFRTHLQKDNRPILPGTPRTPAAASALLPIESRACLHRTHDHAHPKRALRTLCAPNPPFHHARPPPHTRRYSQPARPHGPHHPHPHVRRRSSSGTRGSTTASAR